MTAILAALHVCVFFGVVVFIVSYALLAPFERSEAGLNLMTYAGALALLLGVGVIRLIVVGASRFAPAYWGEGVLVLLGYLVLNVAVWWRWVMLIRAQARADASGTQGPRAHRPG